MEILEEQDQFEIQKNEEYVKKIGLDIIKYAPNFRTCNAWIVQNDKRAIHVFIGTLHGASSPYKLEYIVYLIEKIHLKKFSQIYAEVRVEKKMLEDIKSTMRRDYRGQEEDLDLPSLQVKFINDMKLIQNISPEDKRQKYVYNQTHNRLTSVGILDDILASIFIGSEQELIPLEDGEVREKMNQLNEKFKVNHDRIRIEDIDDIYNSGQEGILLRQYAQHYIEGKDPESILARNKYWLEKTIFRNLSKECNLLYIVGLSHVFPLMLNLLQHSAEIKIYSVVWEKEKKECGLRRLEIKKSTEPNYGPLVQFNTLTEI